MSFNLSKSSEVPVGIQETSLENNKSGGNVANSWPLEICQQSAHSQEWEVPAGTGVGKLG